MKKACNFRTAIFIYVIFNILIIPACQPTPENEIVINKNDGAMEKEIEKGTDISEKQLKDVSQQYKNTLTKANITVNFDAKVDKVDSDTFPVWTAGKYQITQTDADNIAKVLIPPEAEVYDTAQSNTLTKSEIQDKILNCKAEIERIKKLDDEGFSNEFGEDETRKSAIEWINDQIDYYESMINDAPDEKPIVDSDLVFKDTLSGRGIDVYIKKTNKSDPLYFLILRDFVRYGNDEETISCIKSDSDFVVQDSKTMGITLKEAESQASSALRSMGINDMTVVSSGTLNYSKPNEAYFVKYQRILDNKYVLSDIETAPQMEPEDEMATGTYIDENGNEVVSEYAAPLDPEELTVMINKEGIIDLFWLNAKGDFNKITENVELLTFEDIMKKSEDNIFYNIYADKEDKVTVNIESIELNYMCVKQKDSLTKLLAIPVWDFIGFQKETKFGFRISGCYLTLNAIDGTVIDRELGY